MPFTLAHPAAVVPLRRFLVLPAAVVGSLAPDFHYFLNLAPRGHFGHSFKGIFFFCLPVGMVVLWIFQRFMKLPLLSLAPKSHQERLISLAKPFCWRGVKRFSLIVASLLLGAITHLAWDAFTHEHGLVVRNIPDMRTPLEEFGTQRPLYNVLQHGSSLLGLALLAFWYWQWFKRTPPQPVPLHLQISEKTKQWIVGAILIFAACSAAICAYFRSDSLASRTLFLSTFVVTLMSLTYVGTLCFSFWWHLHAARSPVDL
ncbi:MAG TPA: DUF4184 family protein [Candidatus Angelobacter sp.]|nr:DUF4184 family protein [Candidatus Angelobacter sp.]